MTLSEALNFQSKLNVVMSRALLPGISTATAADVAHTISSSVTAQNKQNVTPETIYFTAAIHVVGTDISYTAGP